MKNRMVSRSLSLLLTLCLVLSLVPFPVALADGPVKVSDYYNGGVMYLGEGTVDNSNFYQWLDTGKPINGVSTISNKNGVDTNNSIIGCTFSAATVNVVELLIYEDGVNTKKPTKITVQYWDENTQEFVNVTGQSKNADFSSHGWNDFNDPQPSHYSVIEFDEVETTKIQLVMEHDGLPIGLREFRVWTPGEAPNVMITRQEAMLLVQRVAKVAGFTGSTGNLSAFSDADDVASWALDAAKWGVGSNLIVGSDGKLCPLSNITRSETATLILRLLQKAELVDMRSDA